MAKAKRRPRSTSQPTRTLDLYQNKIILIAILIIALFVVLASLQQRIIGPKVEGTNTGFDEFGYNYTADVFEGKADGVDRIADGKLWGDATYANDHLKMKWSKAWDEARFNGAAWNCDAWTDNQWNGKVKAGSGEVWHYKILWVGPELDDSNCWRDGGYAIWGEFEVVLSQGTVANQHLWDVLAARGGYGIF